MADNVQISEGVLVREDGPRIDASELATTLAGGTLVGDLILNDDADLLIGDPTDASITHNGTDFTIDSDTGHTNITSPDAGNKSVRLNNKTFTATSGDVIGFQSKPASATGTATVYGGQISPRFNDTIAGANLIGLHSDAYLKGTTGDLSGDVRALNLELVTDDAGARTVGGNVNAIRVRSAFSATAITGTFVPIRIEKAETQTGSQQYDAVLELPSTNAGVWNDAPGTEPTTADGYIKVLVNGNARYIQLYSGAPAD